MMASERPIRDADLPFPRFSMAERDRRWSLVRSLMAQEGLAAIIAPDGTGHYDHWQGDVRYLTQVGGNCVDAAALITVERPAVAFVSEGSWPGLAAPHWGVEVLPTNRAFAQAMIPVIGDYGLASKRIGVSGLERGLRSADGQIKWGTMLRLREAFPDATFVDATMLMQEARFVKSDEEIAMLERADALAEKAVQAMIDTARPGVRESEVYAAMIAAQIADGGELPTMISWFSGPPGARAQRLTMASERRIGSPWYITQECEARYAGYVAQRMQPVWIGPLSNDIKAGFEAQKRALFACWEALHPGTTFLELMQISLDAGRGTGFTTPLIIHGRGLGDDAPLIVRGQIRCDVGAVKENAVFQVKPSAEKEGFDGVTWADTVVATANGARRLGKQPIEIAHVE
ncbi:MAG: Xaa-Pro dipeptidase [Chloroflexota bacterium]|nr:Xaa-Pro dipeptidase [Chloroflexota bacterium]